jgi:hypothetical protein
MSMGRSPSRLATWLLSWWPFLTGVALGLALLAVVGAVIAPSTFIGRQQYFKLKKWPIEGRATIEPIAYDWNLNGVPPRR